MGKRWKRLIAFGLVCALVLPGALAVGYVKGAEHAKASALRVAGERAAVEAKILAVIVKKNPDASIRDFADFPGHLLATAAVTGIDFRLAMALIDAESEWRPRAVGTRGEVGLLQVRPPTAALVVKRLGIEGYRPPIPGRDLGTLGDPKQNVLIGLTYLAWQRDEFGPSGEMLRAFNRGPSRAREWWPGDPYVERVGLRLVALVQEFRR